MGPREHEGRSRSGGQSGFTLIEVLIAISLAGILTAALSTGILFLFRANATLTEEQQLQRVLGNLAESIESLEYEACTDLASGDKQQLAKAAYVDELDAANVVEPGTLLGAPVLRPTPDWGAPAEMTVEIVKVEFWRAKQTSGSPDRTYKTTCPTNKDDGSQLVTLEARLGDRSVRTQVVKAIRLDVNTGSGP